MSKETSVADPGIQEFVEDVMFDFSSALEEQLEAHPELLSENPEEFAVEAARLVVEIRSAELAQEATKGDPA